MPAQHMPLLCSSVYTQRPGLDYHAKADLNPSFHANVNVNARAKPTVKCDLKPNPNRHRFDGPVWLWGQLAFDSLLRLGPPLG